MIPPPLLEAVCARYKEAGSFDRGFVRGKLRGDPAYEAIAFGRWLPPEGDLLDLGCGRGILLALLAESGSRLRLHGIEGRADHAALARRALGVSPAATVGGSTSGGAPVPQRGPSAHIETADLRSAALPACDTAVLLDVLHYLREEEQNALLARTARALREGGLLLVREIDAGAGLRAWAARAAERINAAARGQLRPRFHWRTRQGWAAALEAAGFDVETRDMDEGTPFANVLLIGRRRS